jgi:hypothetical protein
MINTFWSVCENLQYNCRGPREIEHPKNSISTTAGILIWLFCKKLCKIFLEGGGQTKRQRERERETKRERERERAENKNPG